MGIGTLRRYHSPAATSTSEPAAPATQALEEAVAEALAALNVATAASEAAAAAAADAPDSLELAEAAQQAATAAQAAQQALEDAQQALTNVPAAEAPKRTATKAEWVTYAEAQGRAVDTLKHEDTGKAFTRDEIAELFLGPKA